MPNGESRNWVRFMSSLEGFYIMHGRWPKSVHVYAFFIEELNRKLSIEDFRQLQSKIKLIPDDANPFYCLDDSGNKYDYAREPRPVGDPPILAVEWLKISEPDYYD